jgi:hypothetical protein
MNLSALSSFPGSLLWFSGASSLLFLVIGLFMSRFASLKRPLENITFLRLRVEAEHWHVPEAALPDVRVSLYRCFSSLTVGFGLGCLFFTLVYALLLISPLWRVICPFSIGFLPLNLWFLTGLMGGSGGGLFVFRQLRREARATRTSGPRRRLRDYRSPLWFVIPGAWLVLVSVLVFTAHASDLHSNFCLSQNFSGGSGPAQIAYPWLGLAGISVVTMEIVLARIASASSPLVPMNEPSVAAVDDIFRQKMIQFIQCFNILQISFFSLSLIEIASAPYNLLGFLAPLGIGTAWLLMVLANSLGGKLTG